MLNLDPNFLMDEVRDAETLRNKHLSQVNQIIARICGNYYRADANQDPTPENYAYQWLSFLMPQIIYERPTITCEDMTGQSGLPIDKWLADGLNHWAKISNIKTVLTDLVFDLLTGYGMSMVSLEIRGQLGDGQNDVNEVGNLRPMSPFWERVRREDVIIDPRCHEVRRARFIGRRFEMDHDDVLRNPLYDLGGMTDLPTLQDEARENSVERGPFPQMPERRNQRRRVVLYEIYVPEVKQLITLLQLSKGGNGAQIIRQVDYYGPDDGPFQLWGNFFPGKVFPLSPLQAVWEQFLELQDHATVVDDAAAREKRIGLVDANDKQLEENLQKVKNGQIIPAKQLRGVLNLDIGGPSAGALTYVALLRDRLDRQMGFTSAQAGKSNSDTATSNDIAAQNASTRVDWIRQAVRDCIVRDLRKVAWYLFNEQSVVFNLMTEHPTSGQMVQATFQGGTDYPGQEGLSVDDFAVDIDIHSMIRVDSALLQKRAQDVLAITTTAAPIIPQTPWINWVAIYDMVGESLNIKGLSEKVLRMDVLQQFGQMAGMPAAMVGQVLQGGGMMGGAGMNPAMQPTANPMRSAAPRVGATAEQGMRAGQSPF